MNVYRHSGKITLIGIPLTVVFGVFTAAVLGLAYSYIVVYDPIIYANALCTVLFGLAVGWSVAKGARLGKIRNPIFAGVYGLAFGCAGLYFAWVADYWARTGAFFDLEAFEPGELAAYISFFYEKGLWSISEHGGKGTVVNGIALGIIWSIEACVVVGAATYMAYKSVADTPFCEACNQWVKHRPGVALVKYSALVRQGLAAGNLDVLDIATQASKKEATYSQLDLYFCSKCDDSVFLSASDVTVTIDKKGKRQTNKTPLVKHLVIAADDVPRVLAAGKRESPPEELELP
jgi:hypothetical protein